MNRFKKAISMILAAVMIASASPLSMAYLVDGDGNAYTEGRDYSYGAASYVTNPTAITIDTSGTTEVVRIAESTSAPCKDGTADNNAIVAANKSGIAQISGTNVNANYAYGNEQPETPVIQMKIVGISNQALIGSPTVSTDQISPFSSGSPSVTVNTSEPSITYTWNVPTGSRVIGGDSTNIVYTINFTYGRKEYTTHAYSYAKNIIRPNGLWFYGITWRSIIGTIYARTSVVTQLLCDQSVPGWAGSKSNERFYINYSVNAREADGDCLDGMGQDQSKNDSGGAWMVHDNNIGNITHSHTDKSASSNSQYDVDTFGYAYDGNRCVTQVYLDKGFDHLGSGTANGKTNGLNMRMTLKAGEHDHFGSAFFTSMVLYNSGGVKTQNGLKTDANNIAVTSLSAAGGTWSIPNPERYFNHRASGDWNTAGIVAAGRSTNGGSYVNADDVYGGGFVLVPFAGTGPQTTGATEWTLGYVIQNLAAYTTPTQVSGNRIQVSAYQSINFNVYDTTNLRNVLNAIDRGTGFSYNGTNYASKGANPQSWMYTSGWSTFQTRYNEARSIIAKFNVTQAQVDTALSNLASAYNGLSGYQETGTITVRHCLRDTNTELVPAQVFTKEGTWAQQSTSTTPIKNGASFSIQALVDSNNACTLKGYTVVGSYVVKGSVSFSASGTSLVDENNINLGSEIVFYYAPATVKLRVGTGVYNANTAQQYIYTTDVVNGTELNSASADVNFAKIKNNILNTYEQPAYTVYGGMYDNAALTGTPVDGINGNGGASSWVMPAESEDLYIKWNAKPVKLKVVTSYGATDTNVASAQTPSVEAMTYTMGTVSFAQPTPPAYGGYDFVNYYTDSSYTNVAEWPLTADYYGAEANRIEVSDDAYNYVTVYAKYVDLNAKVVFDTQGGTIENGTIAGECVVNNNEMPFDYEGGTLQLEYPVPVREGYTFTGWVLSDGTPVSGWTTGNSTAGYQAVENGTHAQTSNAGFIAYATWAPNQIIVTFHHGINPDETYAINSVNQANKDYYYRTTVLADQQVDMGDFPPVPRRYGYVFNYWSKDSRRFDVNGKYPTTDFTLTATWKVATTTAFPELVSYVNVGGTDEIADVQHNAANITEPTAQKGDVVKVRLSVGGKFYAGSSSYIFVYDADVFEAVAGVTATANADNTYISAIHADVTEIKGTAAYNAYDSQMDKTNGKVIDPNTGAEITNPAYIQVTVDPDVTKMTNGYKTVSFDDVTYMLELTLKIKNDTTKTEGSIWIPDELVRSGDNLMGDTYVSYSESEVSLNAVATDIVIFDKEAVSTVKLVPEERPVTTITLALPTKDGAALGQFADGGTANKTYIGHEATEIISTYTTDNVTYYENTDGRTPATVGFPEPTRDGYHIIGWNKTAGTGSAETWENYNYADENQNGNTYTVEWEPNPHVITFYNDEELTNVRGPVDVVYDQVGITPVAYPSGSTTEFIGWIPAGMPKTIENVLPKEYFDTYHVTGDAAFYAYTKTAQKTITLTAYYVGFNDEGTVITEDIGNVSLTKDVQTALGIELRVGDTLKVVNEIPATPEAGVYYITAADLASLFAGTYTYTKDGTEVTVASSISTANKRYYEVDTSSLPITYTVTSATTNTVRVRLNPVDITIYIVGGTAIVNGTATAPTYTGTYDLDADATTPTWSITGKYNESYDWNTFSAGLVAPFGYVSNDFSGTAANKGKFKPTGTGYTATYTARWNPANVNVHWVNYDGTELKTATAKFNANAYTAAPTATREGYVFAGWKVATVQDGVYTPVTDKVTSYTCSANPTTNVKQTGTGDTATYDLYFLATFTANKYNVIYNTVYTDTNASAQYGTPDQVEFGTAYTVKGDATAVEGYTFDGWYNENTYAAKTEKVTNFAMGSSAVNLYGYYVPNSYKVRFMNNDGTDNYTDVDVNYNATITAPEAPTKAGYKFLGWAETAEGEVVSSLGTLTATGTPAKTFYAKWEASEVDYLVEYYVENEAGEFVKTATDTYKGTVGTTASVTEADQTKNVSEGYKFDAASSTLTGTIPETGTLTLKVYIARESYTYSKNIDGTVTEIGTYKYGATLPTVEAPAKAGYTFAGWTGVPADGKMPAANTEIAATWTVNQYTITFNTNGGSAVAAITQDYDTAVTAPEAPTKEGYDFGGWYADEALNNAYTFTTMPAENITVYAKWNINQYTITFNTAGGSEVAPITQDYNTDITAPADPTREGYEFVAWDTTIPAKMPARSYTITATWKLESYTIKFNTNGGSAVPSITKAYGASITAPEAPVLEGYEFLGWYEDEQLTVPYTVPETMNDLGVDGAEITVYAKWNVNEYTITFESNGGSAVTAITQNYNTPVNAPAAPTKTGYDFGGWYSDAALNNAYTFTTMPAENITVYAKWNINQYTITFESNGGSAVAAITQDYNSAVEAPAAPSKAGYDFDKWYADDSLETAYTFATMPAENITVYAGWTIHEYTVSYNLDGALPAVVSTSGEYNSEITLPVNGTDFTKTGYKFMGWVDNSGNTIPADATTYTLPAQEYNHDTITLTAQWEINVTTITFNSNGGSAVEAITQDYGTLVSAPADPELAGYDFVNWYADPELTTVYAFTTMPAESITVYAKWKEHTYTVKFLEPDADSPADGQTFNSLSVYDDYTVYVDLAQKVTAPADHPEVQYFTFVGWATTPNGEVVDFTSWTMPAADKAEVFYFYPVYDRVDVTLNVVISSGAEIVEDENAPEGVTGYIYNVGLKQNKTQVESQFTVEGNGTLVVTPSKGKFCGTASKIELIDNVTEEVVETYYLIVYGDVNGDSNCNSTDLAISEDMLAEDVAWYMGSSVSEKDIKAVCYTLAADVNGDSKFDDLDTAAMQLYILGKMQYSYNIGTSKYITVSKA